MTRLRCSPNTLQPASFPSHLRVGAALGAYPGDHVLPTANPLPATGH